MAPSPKSPFRETIIERISSFTETPRPRTGSGASSVLSPLRLRRYFSRRSPQHELFVGDGFVGMWSPVGVFWGIVLLMIPAAYLYIFLVLLRELCRLFPETVLACLQQYTPWLANVVSAMNNVSKWVEVWCILEAVFYISLKLWIRFLNTKDPLEASLSAAPLMDLEDRRKLWSNMMECESKDPVNFLRGWFFDQDIVHISQYDVRDFIAWSMFEGRHQEHLTESELRQLEWFVEEIQHRISLHMFGQVEDGDNDSLADEDPTDALDRSNRPAVLSRKPKKYFKFAGESTSNETNMFSELYESYRKAYENNMNAFPSVQGLRNMVHDATVDFHPVQDLRNLMGEAGKTIGKAEETAKARATQMYESLIPAGSQMDKQLSAMTHAAHSQATEAWNSVKNVKQRLETARDLHKRRQSLRQKLKGYRALLNLMRGMSSSVPPSQMATVMLTITECNESLHRLENHAQTAFTQATGFAMKTLPFLPEPQPPQRFAKYSSDPLLGITTYPLGFHLLVHGLTELPLRILMYKRGFDRRVIGRVAYYFHPGGNVPEDSDEDVESNTPIVFVHGIGLGLIMYMSFIDALVATGRPILLPEIPYVSGFKPFQSPSSILSPAVVSSTMTAMLASHGFLKATWVGHSYGTSWVSYMCKYASTAVAALLFLDPICFCLHVPSLTKHFVYQRPDIGTLSYMVRTDVTVNWSIQRSFPWAWIILFLEEVKVPTVVFLSEKDDLVPAEKVATYFKDNGVPVQDFENCTPDYFKGSSVTRQPVFEEDSELLEDDGSSAVPKEEEYPRTPNVVCALFRGDGHGDWTDRPSETVPAIVEAAKALCNQVEERTD